MRGVFIIFQISKILSRILIFSKTKKEPKFSVSPLRNPFLVPKRPQNFLRRFAPIRGVFIILKIWSPKKSRGVFIILQILQKKRTGVFNRGGGFNSNTTVFERIFRSEEVSLYDCQRECDENAYPLNRQEKEERPPTPPQKWTS